MGDSSIQQDKELQKIRLTLKPLGVAETLRILSLIQARDKELVRKAIATEHRKIAQAMEHNNRRNKEWWIQHHWDAWRSLEAEALRDKRREELSS